jgi:hypothetical protein
VRERERRETKRKEELADGWPVAERGTQREREREREGGKEKDWWWNKGETAARSMAIRPTL